MPCEMIKDGGWAWAICFGSFLINFEGAIYLNCGGVLLSALVDSYNIKRTEGAWISSLAPSCIYLFAPLSTFCCNRYGARKTVALGALISVTALIVSSFATNIKILYFSYGICGGLGTSLCYFPNFIMISKYFNKKMSTANGISTSGCSIGAFVLSPVMQLLFSRLGMSNGYRVLASFHVILCIPVLLYRPFDTSPEPTKPEHHKYLSSSVCRNPSFLIWLVAVFLFQLNYMVPYIHLVRLGEDVGASKVMASLLISILAGGSFLGRILCGRLADLACCNRLNIIQISLLCIAVSTTLVAFAPSFMWLAAYAALFGFCEGVYIMVFMVITRDIVGTENIAFAIGISYCILSVPKTLGPIVAGILFDINQSYVLPFMIMGGLTILSSMLMFLVRVSKSTNHKLTIVQEVTLCKETIV